jgi:hypothetical protein
VGWADSGCASRGRGRLGRPDGGRRRPGAALNRAEVTWGGRAAHRGAVGGAHSDDGRRRPGDGRRQPGVEAAERRIKAVE